MSEATAPNDFLSALTSLRRAHVHPRFVLEEIAAPRLAPFSAAIEIELADAEGARPAVATFVILYDADQETNWGGPLRVVGHARIEIDAEQSTDPLLPEAVWMALSNSLDGAEAPYANLVGSVTVEATQAFGGLELKGATLNADLRCSWTPLDLDLAPHLEGWTEALRQNMGMEPSEVLSVNGND